MKRSARIAKAKGGGGSGAAATPGADGDDRARAEKKDYIADNPVWRMNLAHSPTRAKTLMELGKDMYEPFGITDRKTQEYVNASAAWTRQRVGNTDLSRNAIARAKRLVHKDAEAAATNAKTYTVEIKTQSGDIQRFPAVIGPGRDGWYRLAVHDDDDDDNGGGNDDAVASAGKGNAAGAGAGAGAYANANTEVGAGGGAEEVVDTPQGDTRHAAVGQRSGVAGAAGAAAGSGAGALVAKMKQDIQILVQDGYEEAADDALELLMYIDDELDKPTSRFSKQIVVNAGRPVNDRKSAEQLFDLLKKLGKREMEKANEAQAN